MKAEERKRLETNTLAQNLDKLAHGFQQGIPRGVWLVLGGIVVVLVLFWTWRYFSERSQKINAGLWYKWDELDSMGAFDKEIARLPQEKRDQLPFMLSAVKEEVDLERLEQFAKENGGTAQGRMARFQLARLFLYEGVRDLGKEHTRNVARERLTKAAKYYGDLIKEAREIPVLHQEALLNCAKANESLGEVDDARKLYKQLQDAYPKSDFSKLAEVQLKRLEEDAKDIEALASKLKDVPAPPPLPRK